MFDLTAGSTGFCTTPVQPTDPLCAFVDQHQDGLLNAATLLGGRRGAGLAQSVIDGLAERATPSRRILRALDELRDLLTLEHVHDFDRDEAAHFAAINPTDPRVEEICLLADGLCEAIGGVHGKNERRAAE